MEKQVWYTHETCHAYEKFPTSPDFTYGIRIEHCGVMFGKYHEKEHNTCVVCGEAIVPGQFGTASVAYPGITE